MRHSTIALLTLLCAGATEVAGQVPASRQRLDSLVQLLQRNPSDSAVRVQIIKLALTLTSKPAAPPEVDELIGRSRYAFEHATSQADFGDAAETYHKASTLVPWVPDYYFNQGVALEKANRFGEAIAAFRWYLVAAPDAEDASGVRQRIGGLEYAAQRAAQAGATRPSSEANRDGPRTADEEFLRSLGGAHYVHSGNQFLDIHDSVIVSSEDIGGVIKVFGHGIIRGREFVISMTAATCSGEPASCWDGNPGVISEDGRRITLKYWNFVQHARLDQVVFERQS